MSGRPFLPLSLPLGFMQKPWQRVSLLQALPPPVLPNQHLIPARFPVAGRAEPPIPGGTVREREVKRWLNQDRHNPLAQPRKAERQRRRAGSGLPEQWRWFEEFRDYFEIRRVIRPI